jgi:uncharacterized protein (TIGR03437 family)
MRRRIGFTLISVLLTAAGAVLSAQTVNVDQTVLNVIGQYQGQPKQVSLNITTDKPSTQWSVFVNSIPTTPWLRLNSGQVSVSGTGNATLTVVADPTGLTPGPHTGQLDVFGNAGGSSFPVRVNFQVSTIGVNPPAVAFAPYVSGTNTFPSLQTITLTGTVPQFSYAASVAGGDPQWFSVINATPSIPGSITVTVNNGSVATLTPGNHIGSITITPVGAADNTPVTIPVSLFVSAAPQGSVNPNALVFNIQNPNNGGTNNNSTKSFVVTVSPPQVQNLAVQASTNSGGNWLVCCSYNPATQATDPNTGQATVTASVNTALLTPNTYTGKINVTVGGSAAPVPVTVTLNYSNNALVDVPNGALNFTYQLGAAKPATQQVNITATSGVVGYSVVATSTPAGWLSAVSTLGSAVTPGSGNTSGPMTVSADPSGLSPGTYNGSIAITPNLQGAATQSIPVVLTVTNNPGIATNVDSMTFAYQLNQQAPAPQTLKITSATGVPLSYNATASVTSCGNSWLAYLNSANPASGSTDATLQVGIVTTGLAAGNCSGSIVISAMVQSTGATVASKTIPVTMLVTTTPQLVATPPALTFSAPQGAPSPPNQTIALSSTSGTDVLSYTVATNGTANGTQWLLSGSQGSTPGTLPVSIFSSTLPAGNYSGNLTIVASTAAGTPVANSPVTVPVTLQVTSGALTLSATQANFTYAIGAASPQPVSVTVGSSTSQALVFTALATSTAQNPWLTVSPSSGNTSGSGTLTISVDGTRLTTPGTYTGSIAVNSPGAGNSPATISVQVVASPATISAPTTPLTFTQISGGPAPTAQTVTVSSTPASIPFTVTTSTTPAGGTWLAATPANGNTPGSVTVSINAGALAAGQYNGQVVISATGATGSPITIPVVLNVTAPTQVSVNPGALTFNYSIGLPAPATQPLGVSSNPSAQVSASASANAPWLTVAPATVVTPAAFSVSINAGLLASPGTYNGTITLTSPNLITPVTVPVTVIVQNIPPPSIGSINNAGSYAPGPVSPGENIVIFGTGIGPATLATNGVVNNAFGAVVGSTRVLFDGVPAPMIYASGNQTSAMVPYSVAGRSATNIVVEFAGVQSNPAPFVVLPAAPGIYTLNQAGTGPGAILNQDGITVNSASTPEKRGNAISVYMTGEGQTNPAGVDGAIIPPVLSALKTPQLPVTATIGGTTAQVLYAGSAAGLVSGVMQVNLLIPANAPTGSSVPLLISVGGTATQTGVTVAIQ